MDLKENLIKYKTKENEKIVEDLLHYIKEENITNIEQLDNLENKIFTINGNLLNDKQRIKYCMFDIVNAYYDYDGLSLNEIKELSELKNNIINDEKNKILNIIKINSLTNREIKFVKEAYDYIINGIL